MVARLDNRQTRPNRAQDAIWLFREAVYMAVEGVADGRVSEVQSVSSYIMFNIMWLSKR